MRTSDTAILAICLGTIIVTTAIKLYLATFVVCPLGLNGWVEDFLGLGMYLAGYDIPYDLVQGPEGGTHFLLAWLMSIFFKAGLSLRCVLVLFTVLNALTVVMVYLICEMLFDRRVGLVAAALTSANYLYTWYSFCLTSDALAVFFSTLAVWLYVLSIKQNQKYLPLVGTATALAFLTRYDRILLVAVFAIHYTLTKRKHMRIDRKTLALSLVFLAAPIICWQLYSYLFFGKLFKPLVFSWRAVLGNVEPHVESPLRSIALRLLYYVGKAYYVISPIGLVLFAVGFAKAFREGKEAWLFITWLMAFFIIALLSSFQDERYFLWWLIPLIVLTSIGFEEVFRKGKWLGSLLLIATILLSYSKFPPPIKLQNNLSPMDWIKALSLDINKHEFIHEYVIKRRTLPQDKYPLAYWYAKQLENPLTNPKPLYLDILLASSIVIPLATILTQNLSHKLLGKRSTSSNLR